MIAIGDTQREVTADVLRAPGGFAWWYVDVVTPAGDGAVLIWSYGLPFLPGYAAAARAGRPQRPLDRPSVSLSVYRRGVPDFYLLQEHAADARCHADVQEIGGCAFRRTVDGGACTLRATLDCALPGTDERLTGIFTVTGAARGVVDAGGAPETPHLWTPLTGPAVGEVSLDVGGRPLARIAGRGYHDRNQGAAPLHELGIGRWAWGRVPLAGRELVYYLLWPSGAGDPIFLGMEIDASGRAVVFDLEVEAGAVRRAFGGMEYAERLALRRGGRRWLDVEVRKPVDAGPFYLRMLAKGTAEDGASALGWSEVCVPGRVDLDAHRPFVRMRVHRVEGPNSPWLPLFTGPRRGRAGRFLRHLFSGRRWME